MKLSRRQFLTGCAAAAFIPKQLWAGPRSASAPLDTAYINARVWTGLPGAGLAQAIGTTGSRISSLDEAQVRARIGKRTQVIDLQGAFVMPGFIDNHTHFMHAATMLSPPNLRNAGTRAEFTRRVAAAADQLPPGSWMRGGSWDAELWGGELPTRAWIDAVTPATPVALLRLDLHMMLLNSLALRLAGIDRHTPDPEGGRIVRDADGEPTGLVIDRAKLLVERVIPPRSDAELQRILGIAIEHGLKSGVTQAHSMGLDWITHDALLRLRAKGETGMRFRSYVPLQDWEKLAGIVKREGHGDDWVGWGGVKVVTDGSLGSRTALFHKPYDDAPDTRGMRVTPLDKLREWSLLADRHGLQIAAHAIGDEANDDVLDLMDELNRQNGRRDRRFRIEHAQHLSPDAIKRLGRHQAIASVQPYHAIDDGRWAVQRVGTERLKGTYAFKSLRDAGAHLSFGSDWPVAPFNPLTGVAAAVLRQTIDGANPDGWMPQQRITMEQALLAYTATNAYAGFQEKRLGQLLPGFTADFVVLDGDLLRIDPQKITEVSVLRTIVDGKQRFAAASVS